MEFEGREIDIKFQGLEIMEIKKDKQRSSMPFETVSGILESAYDRST